MKLKMKLMVICGVLLLLPVLSFGGSYRDKHGNLGEITLLRPIVVSTVAGVIDYTVPYLLTDSEGSKSGTYRITSEMLPGRDPGSNDFVLNVFVRDDPTQKGAELVFRNNPNVSPLAPILRLLDCPSTPCTQDKIYNNQEWGAWIIRDQSDIANYPIELLDARVITQLLESAQLDQLPNAADGTGNWAEIMENHRTNFEEAKFRADIDNLGGTQNTLLTSRILTELASARDGSSSDWLIKHQPPPPTGTGIIHNALTFLTGHQELIEEMADVLFTDYGPWPLDNTFPFGRMPIWLVDPDDTGETSAIGYHVLPAAWHQVLGAIDSFPAQDPLVNAGCFHDFPVNAYVPTLANGSTNIGQYECATVITSSGFIDRPCTQSADYISPGIEDSERFWHNPIHGFIGGSFASATLTSGTLAFWPFHTYASTNTLSNWRHAQKRDMPAPTISGSFSSPIDIFFLVDQSGSYLDDLPIFKAEVPALIDDLGATFSNIQFGIGRFEDYPIPSFGSASSGDTAYERLVDITASAMDVKNAIASLSTRFGSDGPESQLPALYQMATDVGQDLSVEGFPGASIPSGQGASFRLGATKLILLFTDADFHLPGDSGDIPYPGPSFANTVAAILALDPPMVLGVSSGGTGLTDMKAMARATDAFATEKGVDCDGDGKNDIDSGGVLVCSTGSKSEKIGTVIKALILAGITEAQRKDIDGDGVPDLGDNCLTLVNPNQTDTDGNGIGNACENDWDGDGVTNVPDNCPLTLNPDQKDTDGNKIGNVCDPDDDGDRVLDAVEILAGSDPLDPTSTPSAGQRDRSAPETLGSRYLYSFHVGSAHPLGDLDRTADANIHIHFDVSRPFTDRFRLVAMLGLSQFTTEIADAIEHQRWINASFNLPAFLPPVRSGLRRFVQAGPGIYWPKSGNSEGGFNLGVGGQIPLDAPFGLEFGIDYHRVQDSFKTEFVTWQLGLLFR